MWALGQDRGNAIEVSVRKTSIGLYRRNPTSFDQDARTKGRFGKSGRGQRRGKSNGTKHSESWKRRRRQRHTAEAALDLGSKESTLVAANIPDATEERISERKRPNRCDPVTTERAEENVRNEMARRASSSIPRGTRHVPTCRDIRSGAPFRTPVIIRRPPVVRGGEDIV